MDKIKEGHVTVTCLCREVVSHFFGTTGIFHYPSFSWARRFPNKYVLASPIFLNSQVETSATS